MSPVLALADSLQSWLAALAGSGATRAARTRAVPPAARDALEEWAWALEARRRLRVPRRPETFNEKVLYKMANDRRPLLTTLSDKVAARDYVARAIGPHVLPELLLVTDDPEQVRRETLTREVVLKTSHSSGGSVLVAEFAPRETTLPPQTAVWDRFLVHPDAVDWDVLRGLLRDWLARPYKPSTHWANRAIPPSVLAERLLSHRGAVPWDYKLFTFHGRVRVIAVDVGRYVDHVRTLYTPEWERLPFELKFPAGPDVERPAVLGEMVFIAERLARETDFLRVDLFVLGERIVVGELTSFHGAGVEPFRPPSYDRWLGSWWSPPKRYR